MRTSATLEICRLAWLDPFRLTVAHTGGDTALGSAPDTQPSSPYTPRSSTMTTARARKDFANCGSRPAPLPAGPLQSVRMRAPRQLIPTPLLKPAYRLYEARLLQKLDRSKFPHHIAVILDGHRRYARSEGLADYRQSYRAGMAKFEEFFGWTSELGIEAITGWLLSTENLKRPTEELEPLYEVFIEFFGRLPKQANALGYQLRFIGSMDLLPPELSAAAKQAQEQSVDHPRWLTIALGYGGRQEIADATGELVRSLTEDAAPGEDISAQITPEAIAEHLYASDVPDPDLVIRTSGESRLSGFLLWQAAYSEYSFVDVYWPAFRRVDFLRELRNYTLRERRFGQ